MAYDNKIYCQNTQCGLEIRDDTMAYFGRRVYHSGDCQNLAVVHEALRLQNAVFMRFDFVDRESALKLLNEGGLEQTVKVNAGFFRRFLNNILR